MADDSNLDVGQQDAGLAFRAEMWATDFLLRHWTRIGAVVLAVVLGVGLYGQWLKWHKNNQRSVTAEIADIEAELPNDLMTLALAKAGVRPNVEIDAEATRAAAAGLLEIARASSGAASVEAALKSAELYRLIDAATDRRAALEVAAGTASGVLKYAAVAGLANLDIEEGKADDALARYRALKTEQPYLARQATLDLAAALESLDRAGEAVAAYDEYLATWPEASDAEEVRQRRAAAAGQGG